MLLRLFDAGCLGLLKPGLVFIFRHNTHGNRHVGMVFSAQFRALSIENAFLFRLEPGFVQPARHGVNF